MTRIKVIVTAVVEAEDTAGAYEGLGRQLLFAASEKRRRPDRPYLPLESDQPVRELEIQASEPTAVLTRGKPVTR